MLANEWQTLKHLNFKTLKLKLNQQRNKHLNSEASEKTNSKMIVSSECQDETRDEK